MSMIPPLLVDGAETRKHVRDDVDTEVENYETADFASSDTRKHVKDDVDTEVENY